MQVTGMKKIKKLICKLRGHKDIKVEFYELFKCSRCDRLNGSIEEYIRYCYDRTTAVTDEMLGTHPPSD